MTPPRWDSRYADRVREDLVHLVENDGTAPVRRPARAAGGVDRPRLILTGVVAVLVVVVAVLAVRIGVGQPVRPAAPPSSRPVPTATPTPTPTPVPPEVTARLQDAVLAHLPSGSRTLRGLTWTTGREGAAGEAIDMNGKTLLLAVACEGGGALRITISHRPDRVLPCSDPATAGPIDVSAAESTDAPTGVEFDVRVAAGSPRWFAKAVAVDSAQAERFLERAGS
jgi:hypothetical protein